MERCNGTLNVLSLFSGGGGMDLGIEGGFICHRNSLPLAGDSLVQEVVDDCWVRVKPTRFRTIFANDIVPQAGEVWRRYMAQLNSGTERCYRIDSIVDLVKAAEAGEPIFPQHVDLVVGGFPCQDFSVAGARRGFQSRVAHSGERMASDEPSEESRGFLYYWMKRTVDIVKPKMFIAENVKGLTNLGDAQEVIQSDFASADDGGYIVLPPQVLHAADYGVPQTRERVFFIGVRRVALRQKALAALQASPIPTDYSPYPTPTHGYTRQTDGLKRPVTCADVLQHLNEPNDSSDASQRFYSKAKYMGAECQGQTEISLAGQGPTIRSEHHGNIEFRRLSPAHGGKHADELAKGLPERRLTPRECALIQTFPPNYQLVIKQPDSNRFAVSPSAAYKIVGNAVPPILAYSIARRVDELWDRLFAEGS